MELQITNLVEDATCYETIRKMRWPEVVSCPHCKSCKIIKRGKDEVHIHRQRYECKTCNKRFDDLTNTVFSGHHQPLKVWMIFLYFQGLNLSVSQIAKELSLNKSDAYYMAKILRQGIIDKLPEPELSGEVELDEVYVVAGHKGKPDEVKKREEKGEGID